MFEAIGAAACDERGTFRRGVVNQFPLCYCFRYAATIKKCGVVYIRPFYIAKLYWKHGQCEKYVVVMLCLIWH